MKFKKNIKKIFDTETNILMEAKKERALSLARNEMVTNVLRKDNPKKNFSYKKGIAAAAIVIVVMAVAIGTALFKPRTTVKPGTNISENVIVDNSVDIGESQPDEQSGLTYPPMFDTPQWLGCYDDPYAIVEIVEVTDETKQLYKTLDDDNVCVKVKCKILYSHGTDKFDRATHLYDGSGEAKKTPFKEITELYVTKNNVSGFAEYKIVLIKVEQCILNNKYYYSPITNEEGLSEYIPIIDNKLNTKKGYFTDFTYGTFDILNEVLEEYQDIKTTKDEEMLKVLPKEKFADGITMDGIISYLDTWDNASDVYRKQWYGQY